MAVTAMTLQYIIYIHIHMYVCIGMYVCMHVYIHVYVCMYIYIYIYVPCGGECRDTATPLNVSSYYYI